VPRLHILSIDLDTVTDFLQACNRSARLHLHCHCYRWEYYRTPQGSDLLKAMHPDGVIAGVNPAIQPMIAQRLEQAGYRTIRWDDLVTL
jgi:hypothetical protein